VDGGSRSSRSLSGVQCSLCCCLSRSNLFLLISCLRACSANKLLKIPTHWRANSPFLHAALRRSAWAAYLEMVFFLRVPPSLRVVSCRSGLNRRFVHYRVRRARGERGAALLHRSSGLELPSPWPASIWQFEKSPKDFSIAALCSLLPCLPCLSRFG